MLEAFISFVSFTVISWVLTLSFSYLDVAIACGIGLIILECLPEPLNIFKLKDICTGVLGILIGLYMGGWRP
jgi:hypothetical protein